MSFSLNTPPDPDQPSGHTPNLAQVDPPASPGRLAARIVTAAIIVSLLIAAYFYFGQRKPVATGEVTRVTLYPIESVQTDKASEGMAGQAEQVNQLIVFVQLQVRNQSATPLTILELTGNATLPDDTVSTSISANPSDTSRLFGAYPKIATLRSDPLLRQTIIAPGSTAEGLLIFNYALSKAQWDARKKFAISIAFTNGTTIQLDASHL